MPVEHICAKPLFAQHGQVRGMCSTEEMNVTFSIIFHSKVEAPKCQESVQLKIDSPESILLHLRWPLPIHSHGLDLTFHHIHYNSFGISDQSCWHCMLCLLPTPNLRLYLIIFTNKLQPDKILNTQTFHGFIRAVV